MTSKFLIIAFAGFASYFNSFGQVHLDTTAAMNQIAVFRQELNDRFKDPEKTPLKESDLEDFSELDFFPANLSYRVVAEFIKANNSDTIKMKTTTGREPDYLKYAELVFYFDGVKFKLNVYQNIQLNKSEEYKNNLFLPFTDLTNGSESYGGGRYIDLKIPQGKTIVLDFNRYYNPLCAYNDNYSCPIPPPENFMELEIKAGVKFFGKL